MKTEEGWRMYTEMNQLIHMALRQSQIARRLKISRPTLNKYLSMSSDEFEQLVCSVQERSKKPEPFKGEILCWLKEFPDMSTAQVFDWLEEKLQTLLDS